MISKFSGCPGLVAGQGPGSGSQPMSKLPDVLMAVSECPIATLIASDTWVIY